MKSERFIRLGISDILFFRFATISFSTAPMPNVMICASGTASHIPVSFQKNGRIGSIRRGVALKYELSFCYSRTVWYKAYPSTTLRVLIYNDHPF